MAQATWGRQQWRTLLTQAQDRAARILPNFSYDTLPAGHIRLLQILPSSNLSMDCELKIVDIDKAGKYYALSYVCGTGARSETIFVNGSPFKITRNLLDAFKAINEFQQDFTSDRWMWVDAICISQTDVAEKAQQIRLMYQIFSQAEAVLVWLPPMPEEVNMAVEVFRWLDLQRQWDWVNETYQAEPTDWNASNIQFYADKMEKNSRVLKDKYGIRQKSLLAFRELILLLREVRLQHNFSSPRSAYQDALRSKPFTKDLFPPEHEFWTSFLIFMSNEWFGRCWTYQEILVAKTAGLMWPGGHIAWFPIALSRDAVLQAAAQGTVWDFSQYEKVQRVVQSAETLQNALTSTGVMDKPRGPQQFMILLRATACRKASNIKDHVYALFGLFSEEMQANITVDYSKTEGEVFVDAFKAALMQKDGAAMLPELWMDHEAPMNYVKGLPSWVPDFSVGLKMKSLEDSGILEAYGTVDDAVVEKYKALAYVDCNPVSSSLGFYGLHLDSVEKGVSSTTWFNKPFLATLPANDKFYIFWDNANLPERRQWLFDLHAAFCSDDGLEKESSKRLIEFFHAHGCPNLSHSIKELLAYCDLLHGDTVGMRVDPQGFMQRVFDSGLPLQEYEQIRNSFSGLIYNQVGRYVFRTVSGKMGYASKPVYPGDKIIYVPGGQRLHVLSSDGLGYIGSATVEGLMGQSLLHLSPQVQEQCQTFYVS